MVSIESLAGDDAPQLPRRTTCSVPLPTNRGFLLAEWFSDRNIICSGLGNLVLAATSATLTIHKAPIRDGSPYNIRALNAPPDNVDAAPAFALLCASRRDPSLGRVVDADAEPRRSRRRRPESGPWTASRTRAWAEHPSRDSRTRSNCDSSRAAGWRTFATVPVRSWRTRRVFGHLRPREKSGDVATRNMPACREHVSKLLMERTPLVVDEYCSSRSIMYPAEERVDREARAAASATRRGSRSRTPKSARRRLPVRPGHGARHRERREPRGGV